VHVGPLISSNANYCESNRLRVFDEKDSTELGIPVERIKVFVTWEEWEISAGARAGLNFWLKG